MKGLALDVLRVGKKYRLVNYGEVNEFEVIAIMDDGELYVKNIHSLERYYLSDLLRYGRGHDFEIRELD